MGDGQRGGGPDTDELLERIRSAMERFETDPEGGIDALGELYDDHVMFRDPIQTVHGRDAVLAMNRKLVARARELRFEVEEAIASPTAVHIAWVMHLAPAVGPTLRIEGMTRLRIEQGKIVEHFDYWDLLGAVMDTLPLAGSVYRMAVARLG
jgi:limonene-1,2-epoxide hydrolase